MIACVPEPEGAQLYDKLISLRSPESGDSKPLPLLPEGSTETGFMELMTGLWGGNHTLLLTEDLSLIPIIPH